MCRARVTIRNVTAVNNRAKAEKAQHLSVYNPHSLAGELLLKQMRHQSNPTYILYHEMVMEVQEKPPKRLFCGMSGARNRNNVWDCSCFQPLTFHETISWSTALLQLYEWCVSKGPWALSNSSKTQWKNFHCPRAMVGGVLLYCQGTSCERTTVVQDAQQSRAKLRSQRVHDLNRQDNPMGREQNSPEAEWHPIIPRVIESYQYFASWISIS